MTNIDSEYLAIYSRLRDIGADSLMWRETLLRTLHTKLALARTQLIHLDLQSSADKRSGHLVAYPPTNQTTSARRKAFLSTQPSIVSVEGELDLNWLQLEPSGTPTTICSGRLSTIVTRVTLIPRFILILQLTTTRNGSSLSSPQLENLKTFVRQIAESQGKGLALPTTPSPSLLPPKRKEVFDLLIVGKTDSEISTQLDIAVDTVRGHVKAIFKYFQASSRLKLIAMFQNYFPPHPNSPQGTLRPTSINTP